MVLMVLNCQSVIVRRENFRALLSPSHSADLPVLLESVHCTEADTLTTKNIWECRSTRSTAKADEPITMRTTSTAASQCDPRTEAAGVLCGRLPPVITAGF